MGMRRSPHRKRRSPRITGDIWLPAGKKGGASAKAGGGNEPGKEFRDPQGKLHVVPRKTRGKAQTSKRRGA